MSASRHNDDNEDEEDEEVGVDARSSRERNLRSSDDGWCAASRGMIERGTGGCH